MSKALGLSVDSMPSSESGGVDRQSSIYRICVGIFLLALFMRIGLIWGTKSYLVLQHSEVTRVATALSEGRGFANAFGNTGPTAHVSPLYPLLLSLVYRHFGTGVAGQFWQEVLSCFLAALIWSLLPWISDICRLDRRIGIMAALAGGVLCLNRWAETKGWFETALAGLACLLAFMFFMKTWYSRDFSLRAGICAGVLSGLAILVSASLASIALGLLVTGYVLFRASEGRQYLRFGFVSIAVMLAVMLPWALRNYVVLGRVVWTRSNFPLELWVSNNDDARATFEDNQTARSMHHPLENPKERAELKTMGELAYQRKLKGEALRWIESHPKRFLWLTLQRTYYFWFPAMRRPIQTIALGLLTLTSIPALIFLLKKKQLIGYGLLTVFLTYPLVYYLVQAYPRYAYPIEWALYYLSSATIFHAFRRRNGGDVTWGAVPESGPSRH